MSWKVLCLGVAIATSVGVADAQWLKYPAPNTPMRGGDPDLSAKTPRSRDGMPDLSGMWQIQQPPAREIEAMLSGDLGACDVAGCDPRTFSKYFFNLLADSKGA